MTTRDRAFEVVTLACLMASALCSMAAEVAAQTSPDRLRADTRALRQQRAIEGLSPAQPGQVGIDAMNARRELVRGRPGALSPTQRRVERQLDALSLGQEPAASAGVRQPAPIAPDRLPSSYEDHSFLPRNLDSRVVEGLLDRVDDGLADGRIAQARSDLSLAERQLDSLPAAEAAPLRERASVLRSRLAGP